MALPNPWTAINPGDIILYDDHLTDLRTNIDYLDDNAANIADDSTVYADQNTSAENGENTTVDASDYASADSDQDTGENSSADTGIYSSNDDTINSTVNTGVDSGQNAGVDGSNYSSDETAVYRQAYGNYKAVHDDMQ